MLTNTQKSEFIESLFEKLSLGEKTEEVSKEMLKLLMKDTCNGKVYKFRAVNEYALNNLQEGTLYCAQPRSFNDPFDCRVGIDIQSMTNAWLEVVMGDCNGYIEKFVRVYDKEISLESCTDKEKEIFNKWLVDERLQAFIEECRKKELGKKEIEEIILKYLDVFIDLANCNSTDSLYLKQMENVKKSFPEAMYNLTDEQRSIFFEEEASYKDYATRLGINNDVDEISLVGKTYQKLYPAQWKQVRQLEEVFGELNEKLAEQIDNLFRVGCLCTDYKNRLMWSHYADSHKGFCIEYDMSNLCDENKDLLVLPVIYANERIKFPWKYALTKNEAERLKELYIMIRSLITKDDVWNYENEWRIITVGKQQTGNVKMPPISCVYIGAFCREEDKKKLIEIAKERNIPVKQMVTDRGEYSLHAIECK